jgi:hypothetical protein
MRVPPGELRKLLGVTDVAYSLTSSPLAITDSTLA